MLVKLTKLPGLRQLKLAWGFGNESVGAQGSHFGLSFRVRNESDGAVSVGAQGSHLGLSFRVRRSQPCFLTTVWCGKYPHE